MDDVGIVWISEEWQYLGFRRWVLVLIEGEA